VFEAEVARHRLHLVRRGGGDDGDRVPLVHVCLHQSAGFRIHAAGYLLLVKFLAEGNVIGLPHAPHEAGRGRHEAREAQPAEAELGHGRQNLEKLLRRDVAAPDLFLQKDRGREAGDQRPVEIEKRADLRSGRRLLDVLDYVFVHGHSTAPSSIRAMTIPDRAARPYAPVSGG
jgi:hypothetical protein